LSSLDSVVLGDLDARLPSKRQFLHRFANIPRAGAPLPNKPGTAALFRGSRLRLETPFAILPPRVLDT
jgi:hypothetical protein